MKNFLAKMKSANYKQLAIDHGEKVVAGMIGLFLLFALLGTRWSGYEKTPAELKEKVDNASRAISQQTWENSADGQSGKYSAEAGIDEKKVQQLLTSNEQVRANMVEDGLRRWSTDHNFITSVIPSQEPARRPDLLPIEELIATPTKAIIPLSMVSTEPQDGPATPVEINQPRVRLKGDFRNEAGGPMGPEAFPPAGGPGAGTGPEMGMGGQDARGYRFVSIRGIVPLYRQIERVALALNISHRQASALVDYWDFRLERRSRPTGDNVAWSKWEQVDIRTAEDIMQQAAGWDPELIELSLTDPVLTMPLPTRVLYVWDKSIVSHPKVDNYVLPPSQRDRQMEMYENYIKERADEVEEMRLQQKGGLSRFQGGNRQFVGEMGAAPGGMRSQNNVTFLDRIAQNMDRDNAAQLREELRAQIAKAQSAAGRLLLFRYLDFDVRPGTTYQYRVQLQLANPNFERPHQYVIDPEITKDRLLTTPFSQPTAEVAVPRDVNFYVTKVDDAYGSNPPSATFDVYEWSEKYGSTINKELKILFGSFIGDRTTTDVIDVPRKQYLEGEEVDFKSDDVLIDIADAPRSIDVEAHEDLAELPRDVLRRGLGVAEQALLVKESGELVAYDPISMVDSHGRSKKRKEQEDEDLLPIKQQGTAGDEEGAGLEQYEQEEMQQRGRRGRGGNSLRRQGRGARGRGRGPMGIGAGP